MIRECAWCGEGLDDAPAEASDGPVSHGMCAPCERRVAGELGMPVDRYVESLGLPVLLVDAERGGRVRWANDPALRATARDQDAVRDRLLGDVFECENASKPGGCGRTVHCSGCTIRSAVEGTWETGEEKIGVPATLRPEGRNEAVELRVSTRRVGGRVLLEVEWEPGHEERP